MRPVLDRDQLDGAWFDQDDVHGRLVLVAKSGQVYIHSALHGVMTKVWITVTGNRVRYHRLTGADRVRVRMAFETPDGSTQGGWLVISDNRDRLAHQGYDSNVGALRDWIEQIEEFGP